MPGRVKLTTEASSEVAGKAVKKRGRGAATEAPASKRRRRQQQPKEVGSGDPEVGGRDEDAEFDPKEAGENKTKPKRKSSQSRDKRYPCTYDECDKSFTRPCRLDEHLRSHTGERPFKCTADPENCDRSFLRNSHLKAHVRAMHLKDKPYRCTFIVIPGTEDDRGQFGFKRKASEPAVDDKEDGEGEGVGEEKAPRECGARFSTNQHLKRHLESHLKTFPYICKDYSPCEAGFRKHSQLARHIRSAHLGLLPFECPHMDLQNPDKACPESFETKGKLGNHVASKHKGLAEKRFFCVMCAATDGDDRENDKDYGGESEEMVTGDLNDTIMYGMDEQEPVADAANLKKDNENNAIACEINENEALTLEDTASGASTPFPIIQSHLLPPIDPNLARIEARKGFRTFPELRAHINEIHPPTCKECGYRFKRQRDLRIHVKNSHGASVDERRVFECEWSDGCTARFTKKFALKVHIRTVHKGERPFKCPEPECEKTFGHKQSVQEHLKKHAPQDPNAPKKERKPRRRVVRDLTLVERLTGVGYENTGRNIVCPVQDCPWRYARMQDLKAHLKGRIHAYSIEQVEELVRGVEIDMRACAGGEAEEEDWSEESESEGDWSVMDDDETDEEMAMEAELDPETIEAEGTC
ncbi:hypothetical protein RUND412_007326 [Rhizina undulata]